MSVAGIQPVQNTYSQLFAVNNSKKPTGPSSAGEARAPARAKPPASSPVHDLAQKYDVRNMSAPEMRKLANELYDHGVIGDKECLLLEMSKLDVVRNEAGRVVEIRPSQSSEKLDYVSYMEGALEFAKTHGEKWETLENMLSALKMLDSARQGPVNVSV